MDWKNVDIKWISVLIIILIVFSIIILNMWTDRSTGELEFTVESEKIQVQEGNEFNVQVKLTNVGYSLVNVWKLARQISYNVNIYHPNGTKIEYIGPVYSRLPLTDKDLVELSPSESIKSTVKLETRDWGLDEGNYTLNAVYHTDTGEHIEKPYWLGSVESNNVTLVVR